MRTPTVKVEPFKINIDQLHDYLSNLEDDAREAKLESYFDYFFAGENIAKKDSEYLEIVSGVDEEDEAKYLQVKEDVMVKSAKSLIYSLFVKDDKDTAAIAEADKMVKKLESEYKKLCDLQPAGERDQDDKRLYRVLFLYDHIDFLQKLDGDRKLLKLAKDKFQRVKDESDTKTAHKFNVRDLFDNGADSLAGKVFLPTNVKTQDEISSFISLWEGNIEKYERAFKDGVGNIGKINDVEDIDHKIEQSTLMPKALGLLGKAQKGLLHITGISRESSPINDKRWREFVDIRNKMMASAENSPDLTSEHVDFRRSYLQSLFNAGLIGREEFNLLSKELDNQKGKFTEEHKKRLEALNKMAEDVDRSLLDKIEKDLDASDELYQAKILHFLILSSVVFPVPIFGLLFDFLEPFLGGDLNLSEFLTSFFSVDGPFGKFAWVFDKMELDKAVSWITGDILGGPFDIVNGLLQNGITTPIASSVGNGVAGSPLSGLILLGLAEATTRVVEKTANHNVAGKNILSDAVKSLEKGFLDQYRGTIEKNKLFEETSLKSEFDIKRRIFLADDAAKWLKEQHNKYPKSCEAFIKNILGDKAAPILKILNGADKDAILTNLVKHFYETEKEGKLFEKIAMLKKAEETPEGAKKVAEIFWSNFNYERLEKLKTEYPLVDKAEDGLEIKELKDFFEENEALKVDFADNPPRFIKISVGGKTCYHELSPVINLEALQERLLDLKQIIFLEDKIAKQPSHIANALKDIKYDEVKQKLERDFGFHLAERHNLENPDKVIEHQYLPAKINGIFQEGLKDQAIAILEALDSPFEMQQLNIFGKKIFDAAQKFNTENGHQPGIAELKELLTGDILSEVADRVLLVKFMQRTEQAEYVKLLEESKGVDFNFDKFWQENLKGRNQETVLRYEKSIGKLQCLAIQHYMQDGDMDKDQARENFIIEIFGDSVNKDTPLEDLDYTDEHIKKLSDLSGSIKQEYDAKAPTIDGENFVKMQVKMRQESPSPITSPRGVSQLKSGGIGR